VDNLWITFSPFIEEKLSTGLSTGYPQGYPQAEEVFFEMI
jgi:hypothetical protein